MRELYFIRHGAYEKNMGADKSRPGWGKVVYPLNADGKQQMHRVAEVIRGNCPSAKYRLMTSLDDTAIESGLIIKKDLRIRTMERQAEVQCYWHLEVLAAYLTPKTDVFVIVGHGDDIEEFAKSYWTKLTGQAAKPFECIKHGNGIRFLIEPKQFEYIRQPEATAAKTIPEAAAGSATHRPIG